MHNEMVEDDKKKMAHNPFVRNMKLRRYDRIFKAEICIFLLNLQASD